MGGRDIIMTGMLTMEDIIIAMIITTNAIVMIKETRIKKQIHYTITINYKTKGDNMHNRHSFAQFTGAAHGRGQHPFLQSLFRAPVNIYKTGNSFEILVFAPGRVKENFSVKIKGNDVVVSYKPQEGLQSPDWIKREYSRGAFERTFTIDDTVDITNIQASYVDGVLQVSLPVIPGKETPHQDVPVN